MAHTFKEIKVWQKAHELVLAIYRITEEFPTSERYGLTSQIRRSCVSVPTNIVEGYKRKSDKDFAHFLNMADSSLEETKYHLFLSHDLRYLNKINYSQLSSLADEIGRMLYGFQNMLRTYSL
ncbi:MAG: four helix bundle protein [Candidatus Omnitrophica bacterium CG11_big_fil_rev_8_21_14_0_20_43_6]|nr:MAG: four helix bundle protein [Candidatus Omnitrophica bacterium CG11_big_fil_rev_8_21_14_0_20_43_6]